MANTMSLGGKNAFVFHRCHLLIRLQTYQTQSIMPTQTALYVMGYSGDQSHIYKPTLSSASQVLPRNLGIRSNNSKLQESKVKDQTNISIECPFVGIPGLL